MKIQIQKALNTKKPNKRLARRLKKLQKYRRDNMNMDEMEDKELTSLSNDNDVIVKETVCVDKQWICPHCGKDISEKGIFMKDDKFYHRLCKEQIILPSRNSIMSLE